MGLRAVSVHRSDTTHHVGVVRRSDSFVVEVIPVDWSEKGVVLYF